MARYRQKDEPDMAWNRTRRRITMEVNVRMADLREEILNRLLPAAFERHAKAQKTGETIHLEEDATAWLDALMRRNLLPVIEADLGDLDKG